MMSYSLQQGSGLFYIHRIRPEIRVTEFFKTNKNLVMNRIFIVQNDSGHIKELPFVGFQKLMMFKEYRYLAMHQKMCIWNISRKWRWYFRTWTFHVWKCVQGWKRFLGHDEPKIVWWACSTLVLCGCCSCWLVLTAAVTNPANIDA